MARSGGFSEIVLTISGGFRGDWRIRVCFSFFSVERVEFEMVVLTVEAEKD